MYQCNLRIADIAIRSCYGSSARSRLTRYSKFRWGGRQWHCSCQSFRDVITASSNQRTEFLYVSL